MRKACTVLLLALVVFTSIGPVQFAQAIRTSEDARPNAPVEETKLVVATAPAGQVVVHGATKYDVCVDALVAKAVSVQQTVDLKALLVCDSLVIEPASVATVASLGVVQNPVRNVRVAVLPPVAERVSSGLGPWYPETQPSALLVAAIVSSRSRYSFLVLKHEPLLALAFTARQSKTLAQLGFMLC